MQKGPPTPKGFRDLSPALAQKKRGVILKIAGVLEEFGFEPIETPTIEFAETLKGKYGEEEKLIYEFKDRGGRELALRYDLTVPLARYVATYNSPLPFRRYQIGQVFRGENPQAGRYREFTQFDFDTVGFEKGQGDQAAKEDAKIIAAAVCSAKSVGIKKPLILINDRANFEGLPKDVIIAFDKLEKIGEDAVIRELMEKGFDKTETDTLLRTLVNKKPTDLLKQLFTALKALGVKKDEVDFSPFLARGLDYYTSTIFELKANKQLCSLSIGAGGRYDNLIGMFSKKETPAVGFSFGLDRLIEALTN